MGKSGLKELYRVPVLSKALDILEFLQTVKEGVGLEELYQQTQFSKTTVYRIVKTLERRGMLPIRRRDAIDCCCTLPSCASDSEGNRKNYHAREL